MKYGFFSTLMSLSAAVNTSSIWMRMSSLSMCSLSVALLVELREVVLLFVICVVVLRLRDRTCNVVVTRSLQPAEDPKQHAHVVAQYGFVDRLFEILIHKVLGHLGDLEDLPPIRLVVLHTSAQDAQQVTTRSWVVQAID